MFYKDVVSYPFHSIFFIRVDPNHSMISKTKKNHVTYW